MSIQNIIYIALGLLLAFFIFTYNGLIRAINRVKEAWADIDVQLKRRYDLIPNLVSTVQGYAAQEKNIFENVSKARSAAMGATGVAEKGQAEMALSGTLKTLFAVAEAYPQLRSNENFMELQKELTDTENKIQAARRFYNGNVRDFNTSIQVFPQNIIAKSFGFSNQELFSLGGKDEERESVQVKF